MSLPEARAYRSRTVLIIEQYGSPARE